MLYSFLQPTGTRHLCCAKCWSRPWNTWMNVRTTPALWGGFWWCDLCLNPWAFPDYLPQTLTPTQCLVSVHTWFIGLPCTICVLSILPLFAVQNHCALIWILLVPRATATGYRGDLWWTNCFHSEKLALFTCWKPSRFQLCASMSIQNLHFFLNIAHLFFLLLSGEASSPKPRGMCAHLYPIKL